MNYLSDAARLRVLRRSVLLDSPAEKAFDRLTSLASRLLAAPVALVSLVDEERQFFKSCVGLPEPWTAQRETPLSHSFCQHAVESRQPLIIEDARTHPLVLNNLAVRDLGVVAYAGIPLIVNGEALGSFCVIDSRPRAWTTDEIATLSALADSVMSEIELRMISEEARKAVLDRGEMLAMISHDLRNPAGLTVSAAQLLQESWLTEEQRIMQIDIIERAGNRMLRLIDDLLTASHLDSGTFPRSITLVDVSSLARETISDARVAKSSSLVTLQDNTCAQELIVNADADLLRRVLDNLLDNAFKFTPANGRISVRTLLDGDRAVVRITDTGKGISPDNIERLFDRYVQLQNNRMGGVGLGLSIARGIIEVFGGKLYVAESLVGVGTTFELVLPLATAAHAL